MKRFVLLLTLACLGTFAFAQKTGNFDGTIVFNIEYSGDQAEMMNSMAPSAYIYHVRGDKVRFKMEGGMSSAMMGDIIIDGKKGESYMLRDSEKKALRFPEKTEEDQPEVKVKRLSGSTEILGYTCHKYKVTSSTSQGTITQTMWVSPDLRLQLDRNAFQSSTAADMLAMKELDGIPLKMETAMPIGNMRMVRTASELTWEKIAKSKFEIPKGYEVEELDIEKMRQEMGGMR